MNLKQQVLNNIKEYPFSDLESIAFNIGVPKNHISRILHQLENEEVVEYTFDPNSFGSHNSQGGTSYGTRGWVIKN